MTTKPTRADWARGTLAAGVGNVILGALILVQGMDVSLPADLSVGRAFLIVGAMALVVGGMACSFFVERGHRRGCWTAPQQRERDDRSLVRRLFGTLDVPADIWWPAKLLQNSLIDVIVVGGFFVWLLFVDPAVLGMFSGVLVAGVEIVVMSGAWLLIALLRR